MKQYIRIASLLAVLMTLGLSHLASAQNYTLTVTPRSKEGTVRGDAQYATGMTIDCGIWDGSTKCSHAYPAGTTVILSGGVVATGYKWDGWSGACSGSSNRCVLVMDGNKTVTGKFANIGNYTVTVSPKPTDGMIAGKTPMNGNDDVIQCGPNSANRCSFTNTSGAPMEFFPFPRTGYKYTGWTGACAGQGYSCKLSPTANITIGQNFAPTPLRVTITAPANGSVSVAGKTCPGDCSLEATMGSKVVFTATAAAGYIVQNWGGACAGQGNPCTLTIDAEKKVSITFVQK